MQVNAAAVARGQVGLARALWWALRRRSDVGPDDVPIEYNGPDRVILYTVCTLGALETAVVHVLVSWPALRWSLFVLGVYGILAFIAWDFTVRQHPHVLRAGELLLRFGHFRSVRVPLGSLTSVQTHVDNGHRKTVELDGDRFALSFMGGTTVELRFSPPVEVTVDGRMHAVARVCFAAHDHRAAVAVLRPRATSTS